MVYVDVGDIPNCLTLSSILDEKIGVSRKLFTSPEKLWKPLQDQRIIEWNSSGNVVFAPFINSKKLEGVPGPCKYCEGRDQQFIINFRR